MVPKDAPKNSASYMSASKNPIVASGDAQKILMW